MKKITLCLMLIFALIIVPGAIFATENVTEVGNATELTNALTASGTVTLNDNINLDTELRVETGIDIVLDLNGKTLSLPAMSGYSSTVKGSLVIKGNGTVNVNGEYGIVAFGGNLTIENGTFNGPNAAYLISDWGGKIVIKDGTFNSKQYTVNGLVEHTVNPVEIKNGTFNTEKASDPNWAVGNVLGNVKVSKGTFNSIISGSIIEENAEITIKLDKDNDVGNFWSPTSDETIVIPNGSKVTIDLNGKTLSGTQKIFDVKGAELTITGEGTIKETNPYYAPIYVSGDSASKTTINIGKNVTLEGWSGVMVSSDAANAKGIEINVDGKINSLTDASGSTGSGIYINGGVKNKDIVDVNLSSTAVINSTGAGIYAAGYATWNINGSKITGVESGLGIKAGKFNIKNATITGTGEDKSPTTGYNNGINPSGAAIQLESNDGYAGNIEISISGGNYESKQGMAIYEYLAKDPNKNIDTNETKVNDINITSGNFTAAPNKEAVLVSADFEETFADGFITGGTFSSDVKEYISSELNTWENQDGTVEVVKERKIEMYVVAINGDVQFGEGAYSRDGLVVGRVGEKVYLSVTQDEGYEVVLTIKDAEGKDIAYGEDYSFVMPDSDVSIKAEFTEKVVTPPAEDEDNTGDGTVTPPAGDEGTTGEGGTGEAEPESEPTVNPDIPEVPKTGDNVILFVALAGVALMGILKVKKINVKTRKH